MRSLLRRVYRFGVLVVFERRYWDHQTPLYKVSATMNVVSLGYLRPGFIIPLVLGTDARPIAAIFLSRKSLCCSLKRCGLLMGVVTPRRVKGIGGRGS